MFIRITYGITKGYQNDRQIIEITLLLNLLINKAEESTPDGTSMLRNALAEDVQAGDLKMTIRYMIYYNKCTKTYQLVNSYLANIPTATA